MTSLEMVHVCQTNQCRRPQRSWRVHRQRPFEPHSAFFEQTALGPEPEQCPRKLEALLRKGRRLQGPLERRPDVFLLDAQSAETAQLIGVAEYGQCPPKLAEEILEMPLAELRGGTSL